MDTNYLTSEITEITKIRFLSSLRSLWLNFWVTQQVAGWLPAYSSIFPLIPTYFPAVRGGASNVFQPIPAYSNVFQLIPG